MLSELLKKETLKKLQQKIEKLGKNPRIKLLGFFLLVLFLFLEPFLRFWSYELAHLLNLVGETFLEGKAEITVQEILYNGAPIIFLYFPSMIFLWIVTQDGYQKIDWILGPILIGILTRGGIYGLICINKKSDSFWKLIELGFPQPLIYFFIFLFLGFSLWALILWIEYLLKKE